MCHTTNIGTGTILSWPIIISLRKEVRRNYAAWLQGAYIYDALCAVSPILHAFAKGGTKPIPYLESLTLFSDNVNNEQDTEAKAKEGEQNSTPCFKFQQRLKRKPSAVERHFLVNGGDVDGADDRRVTS